MRRLMRFRLLCRRVILCAAFAVSTGCVAGRGPNNSTANWNSYVLEYELRVRKSTDDPPFIRVFRTSDWDTASTSLRPLAADGGAYNIFSDARLIHDGEERRAFVVEPDGGETSQVFVLPIPPNPQPVDWTDWLRPSYVEPGEGAQAAYTFRRRFEVPDRSRDVPPGAFELRYRILRWSPAPR